jgi:hypothetical protein
MVRARARRKLALAPLSWLACLVVLSLSPSGAAGAGSITDKLSADGTAVEVTSEPEGTALVHVAVMDNLGGEGLRYLNLPGSQTRYVPPSGMPVVDVQAFSSSYTPIGGWAGRLRTVPAEGSITAQLSADRTAVEVTSEPPGTAFVHVAVMGNLASEGLTYLNLPGSQKRYVPPTGTPIVDVQAFSSSYTPIGSWAGRMQTVPHEEPIAEEPIAEEPIKEEPVPEEPVPEEPVEEEHHEGTPMRVGVDSGGWNWESAVRDFSGAAKYVRSSYTNYSSDSQMNLLARYGVHLLPLFNISPYATSRAAFASAVLAWFHRYGHGGTFWSGKTDLGATTAEIVNEPGNPYFWGSGARTDQAAYSGLVEAVAGALTALPAAHRPRLLVSFDGGYEGDSYGRALIRQDPHLLQLGLGWTVHPYGGTSNAQRSTEGNRPRVTEAHQATGQPVYVTEVGWPTASGQPPTGDSMQWTEQQQAANIRSFVNWARGLGYVDAVVNFNYADYGSNNWYGIVDHTGTHHKLSYATLAGL